MGIFIYARVINKYKRTSGYKIVSYDSSTGEAMTKAVSINNLVKAISSGQMKVENCLLGKQESFSLWEAGTNKLNVYGIGELPVTDMPHGNVLSTLIGYNNSNSYTVLSSKDDEIAVINWEGLVGNYLLDTIIDAVASGYIKLTNGEIRVKDNGISLVWGDGKEEVSTRDRYQAIKDKVVPGNIDSEDESLWGNMFDEADGLGSTDGFDEADGLGSTDGFDEADGLGSTDGFDEADGLGSTDGFDEADGLGSTDGNEESASSLNTEDSSDTMDNTMNWDIPDVEYSSDPYGDSIRGEIEEGDYKILTEKIGNDTVAIGIMPSSYSGKVVIGGDIQIVGKEAFAHTNIREVVIEDSIRDIGMEAFALSSVEVIKLPKHLKFISFKCFYGCKYLAHVIMGDNIERVHESAFEMCFSLVKIELSHNVTEIARRAFYGCKKLESVVHSGSIKTIGQSAFELCTSLKVFNFNGITSIGAASFKESALIGVNIKDSTYAIGRKAFYACVGLKKVYLGNSVVKVDEGAFGSRYHSYRRNTKSIVQQAKYRREEVIDTPTIERLHAENSIVELGNNAFDNVGLIETYTHNAVDNYCKAFGIPVEHLDMINKGNTTIAEIKGNMLNADMIKVIWDDMQNKEPNTINDAIELDESKMKWFRLSDEIAKLLDIPVSIKSVEPNTKFKGLCNIITSLSDMYQIPLTKKVLRFIPSLLVRTEELVTDGYNSIYKVRFMQKDTLYNGTFILIVQGEVIRYCTFMCNRINIECDPLEYKMYIPFDALTVGDHIGKEFTILSKTRYDDTSVPASTNVGKEIEAAFNYNAIKIPLTLKEAWWIFPSVDKGYRLSDDRKYDRDKRIDTQTPDNIAIVEVSDIEGILKRMQEKSQNLGSSKSFFDTLYNADDSEAEKKNDDLSKVRKNEVLSIWRIAQVLKEKKEVNSMFFDNESTSIIDMQVWEGITKSYWTVVKDIDWLNKIGTKSLNQIETIRLDEHHKLVQYQSNQIVQFNNPYMNGGKHMYIYAVHKGKEVTDVYASALSLKQMLKHLYEIVNFDDTEVPELMVDTEKFDDASAKLFWSFYDLVYSKNGWNAKKELEKINKSKNKYRYDYSNLGFADTHIAYNIAMYKPTGRCYVTISFYRTKLNSDGKNVRAVRTVPILPVGDMDRALYVAATTNNAEAKLIDSDIKYELLMLTKYLKAQEKGSRVSSSPDSDDIGRRYLEARKLAIEGVSDINRYNMIDDRVKWLIGTV